jgi:hypothetical protein
VNIDFIMSLLASFDRSIVAHGRRRAVQARSQRRSRKVVAQVRIRLVFRQRPRRLDVGAILPQAAW